jgi:peptide/nickel transport system substrate-binding protein
VVFSDGSKLDAATVVKNFDFWKKLSTSVADSF